MDNTLPVNMTIEKSDLGLDEVTTADQLLELAKQESSRSFWRLGELAEKGIELGLSYRDMEDAVDFSYTYIHQVHKCYERFAAEFKGCKLTLKHFRRAVHWDDGEQWLDMAMEKGWNSKEMESQRTAQLDPGWEDEEGVGLPVDAEFDEALDEILAEAEEELKPQETVSPGKQLESEEVEYEDVEDEDVEYEEVEEEEEELPAAYESTKSTKEADPVSIPEVGQGESSQQAISKLAANAIKVHCAAVTKTFEKIKEIAGDGPNYHKGEHGIELVMEALSKIKGGSL